ncbi:MAG: SctK family type III secretion system sorting platform protein [Thiofilum sp.]|uniref:SctK family type III secretion system sorting platform protein n=1 Tax=Thiofilum sp. TaxID=2212733 RepID=UPI0025DFA0B2|nr:SctK family type III secretion system sorting platform protein [Thiofilum sp.]MBK8453146.1 SctK family type III secretion system sorting platform protein [Thiofilum sp.]
MDQQKTTSSNKKLSSLVWEFNFRPDNYIHASWLAAMPDGELISKLVGKHRGAERVVQHLMGRLGLENQVYFNFSSSLAKMALWLAEDLETLVLHAGAVMIRDQVQRSVSRDDVVKIRADIGDDLYFFIQRRVPMVMRRPPVGLEFPNGMELKKRLILGGMLCFNEAFMEFPLALRKRLMIKLPIQWYELLDTQAALGQPLRNQHAECVALIQKIAIDIKIGVSHDGKIRLG